MGGDRWLLAPRCAVGDVVDPRPRDAEAAGYCRLAEHAPVQKRPDHGHRGGAQFVLTVSLAARRSELSDHIGRVQGVITQEEVIWPHAAAVVAGVQNEHPVRDRSAQSPVGEAVGSRLNAPAPEVEDAVAVVVQAAEPLPARGPGGAVDPGPEARQQLGATLFVHPYLIRSGAVAGAAATAPGFLLPASYSLGGG